MCAKKININQKLIWDYDFSEADYETEVFKEWYVARVLTRGGIDDIRNIGIRTIEGYLLRIHLPNFGNGILTHRYYSFSYRKTWTSARPEYRDSEL